MTAEREIFDNLSAFYIYIWSYTSSFFDDTRWMQIGSSENDGPQERFNLLERRYTRLLEEVSDRIITTQIRYDFNAVEKLRHEFQMRHKNEPPNREWRGRAEKLRTYSQELGSRYAEMALHVPK